MICLKQITFGVGSGPVPASGSRPGYGVGREQDRREISRRLASAPTAFLTRLRRAGRRGPARRLSPVGGAFPSRSGSLAMLAAMRRASRVSKLTADRLQALGIEVLRTLRRITESQSGGRASD